ncbi:MAG: hypothetical protein IJM65_01750 [Bacteroidales bacterium]|nr:hypothetical protein [Bacteroidales bacterium]
MWTRRKKQNLFYLLLGVLIGVAASCIVVSFQVIKRFTRENIAKWHEMRGRDTVQVVTYRPVPAARAVPAKEPAAADSLSTSDSLPSEGEEVILSDVRIASAQIQVPLLGADSSVTGRQALLVEQWENPMHFQGYRWDGQQLLVYGLNLDELDLSYRDGRLVLRCRGQELALKETAAFVRFPAAFLHASHEE